MNSNLERVKQLDSNLATLNKILERKEYLAAGIGITINVGQRDPDDDPDLIVSLGMQADLADIMLALKRAIIDSRNWRVQEARKDMEELQKFFSIAITE